MKLMDGIYTQHSYGYSVWEAEVGAESLHRGGIAISWQREEGCQLEGENCGPKMVIFTIIAG